MTTPRTDPCQRVLTRCRVGIGLVCALASGAAVAQTGADPIMELLQQRGEIATFSDQPHPPAANVHAAALVYAMAYVGVPYRRGGAAYEDGVDCSGFVQVTFRETMGVLLPRRAAEQAATTMPIEPHELQPGDLVFFNTLGTPFSHVGIYIGQGRFVHSPRSGAQVRLERMDERYWRSRFDGARRVPLQTRDWDAVVGPDARPQG